MKRLLKIFFISLGSLIAFLLIVVSIALWFVFTPKRLTPFVQKQVDKYITCKAEIGAVELTFFSTFPKFGIKVNKTLLINSFEGAPCDTLLITDNVIGIINLSSLINDKELIINDFRINNGTISLYTNSYGESNYDVFSFETDTLKEETDEFPFKIIDINNVEIKNIDILYISDEIKMKADIKNLTSKINGLMDQDDIQGFIETKPFQLLLDYELDEISKINADISGLSFELDGALDLNNIKGNLRLNPTNIYFNFQSDSLELIAKIKNFSGFFEGEMKNNSILGQIDTKPFITSLDYNGDNYLKETSLQLNTTANLFLPRQILELGNTKLTVNDLLLELSGTLENDTTNKTLITDLTYSLKSWQIKNILVLVPEIFSSYLESIDISGVISSKGKISGNLDDKNMPLANISIDIKNGTLNYSEIPLPISEINGNFKLFTDFKSPSSYFRINNFSANTPHSKFYTQGNITNLFDDIRADLNSNATLNLSEFEQFIPDTLNLKIKGTLSANLKTNFSMSQIEKMELEKMKISGLLTFTKTKFDYDSISVTTDNANIEFMLPNNYNTKETNFIFATLSTNQLEAKKLESFNTVLKKASFEFETSDVRDSTCVPNILCSFNIGLLTANMDSIGVAISNPKGQVAIAPQKKDKTLPEIKLAYQSERIDGDLVEHSLILDKIAINLNIENNPEQKDILFQWNPSGSIKFEDGRIISSFITYPIDINAIKMYFDSETFKVEQANIKIDKSDFSLQGQIINISSYFRGDSILRGNLQFISDLTDIVQLMALTSGIGTINEEVTSEEILITKMSDTIVDEEIYQGPYFVPRGIDFHLHTNINKATYGNAYASDIKGNVQIYDGILVLDELSFTTPAADMLVTALYKSPRKNHLFLGTNLHMLNIEIAELLRMAPDLDTIMPMLKSFAGQAEFHFAFESNLDSLYNFKKSTMLGSSSIRGNDLVLMDSETFGNIANTLRFRKKTENKVDSLSAEFTITRGGKINVYPFLIVMDKYKAVVGGRHNLDMSYDYNISLVESPLPIRLSVDVKGTSEKMKYKLKLRSRYPKFYRPRSPGKVENEQRNLRNIIRESLLKSLSKNIESE